MCISSEYPEGSGNGVVASYACALVNVLKPSGDRVEKARCQRILIGLSVGAVVSICAR